MNRMPRAGDARIAVIASPIHLDALRTAGAEAALPGLRLEPRAAGEPIGAATVAGADLIVIEVNPEESASIARISAVRERHRDIPVVAAIAGVSVSLARTLVREGIADIVSLPFDPEELLQASLDALASRQAQPAPQAALAPVIAVARSIGGCGATSIATNLAADLARNHAGGRGAVIVDFDLQFGSVGDYLGVRPHGSVADLVAAGSRLDEELLRSIASDAGSGLSVVAAPEAITPLESIRTEDLLPVLDLLRRQYGYVVLDLPANWTNWSLSLALGADVVLLVVELGIGSLRQAKRRIELFRSVGIEDQHVKIVVNRVEKRLFRTIGIDDVTHALGLPVLGTVALDEATVGPAQDQGVRASEVRGKSKFVADIADLGEQLHDELDRGGR